MKRFLTFLDKEVDSQILVFFFKRCYQFQDLTGISSFRVGRFFAICVAIYTGVAAFSFLIPAQLGFYAVPWLIPLNLIWLWAEIRLAARFQKAEEAWNAAEDDAIPTAAAELIYPALHTHAAIFRVIFAPFMLGLWPAVLTSDLLNGHFLAFFHDLLYVPWLLNLYVQAVIPQRPKKGRIQEWIEKTTERRQLAEARG